MTGRVWAAPVTHDGADWGTADVVLPTPAADLGRFPDAGELLVQILGAEGVPPFTGVRGLQLLVEPLKFVVDTTAPLDFLAWAGFFGLAKRSQRTEIITGQMTIVRTGHVIVCGIRVAATVGWRTAVQEIGS